MMNTPETPSAKTGSPFLTTLPSLLKTTVGFAFIRRDSAKSNRAWLLLSLLRPFPKVSLAGILISLTLFLDIRQQSPLKNHNFNDFTNFS